MALAHLQTGLVTLVALDAAIDGRVLVLGRHVWRDLELSAALDEGLAVVAFVGTDRGPLVPVAPAPQHGGVGYRALDILRQKPGIDRKGGEESLDVRMESSPARSALPQFRHEYRP